jgi:predicted ArsR family transcriptional regulator
MKTIKQIADELGVSKTAVRKKIENLGLQSSLRKNGNQFAIDEIQEKLIKQAFSGNETETKNANQSQTENHEVSDLVSVLQTTISVLKAELEAKDRQIEKLQMLLDQEQQLHALTVQQIKVLPEQKEPDMAEEKKWWQFWK